MKTINGAAFRKRQAQHMDECEATSEPILVCTNKGRDVYQQMVVIPESQYRMMIEQINKVDK